MNRTTLPLGCLIKLKNNDIYEIVSLIGRGGNALIYTAQRVIGTETEQAPVNDLFVIKECFPLDCVRNEVYEIVPETEEEDAFARLSYAKDTLRREALITAEIYKNSAHAAIAVFAISDEVEIFQTGFGWHHTKNLIMVEENLSEKGQPLSTYAVRPLPLLSSLYILEQLLYNLEEIHKHNFIHGDLSLSNIFVKGSILHQGIVSLIDFGCARPLREDGYTDALQGTVMTTGEFSAPELKPGNRIDITADLYSASRIFLHLLLHCDPTPANWDFEKQIILNDYDLSYTDVPAHLYQGLNQILSKALCPNIEARYPNATAYLEDIKSFHEQIDFKLDLLYDSFDVYITFSEADRDLAVNLQTLLSDFDVNDEKDGKRQIRSFLDKGELAGCYDQTIKEAVDCTQYLLVIYRGQTDYSDWMCQQTEAFRKIKGKENVILWNLSGKESSTSDLPVSLRRSQEIIFTGTDNRHPAKADLLAIAALVTNKSLEQIKQEQRRKKAKKAAICAAVIGIASIVCLAVSLPQYHKLQISRAQERRDAATIACSQAIDAYNEGDASTAQNLLSGSLDLSSCLVPEQLSVLNTLSGAYDTGTYKYRPLGTTVSNQKAFLSDDGSQALVIQKGSAEIIIWDCINDCEIARADYKKLGFEILRAETGECAIRDVSWISKEQVVLFSDDKAVSLDLDTMTPREFELPTGFRKLGKAPENAGGTSLAYIGDLYYGYNVCVLQTQTGEVTSYETEGDCNDLVFSADGKSLYAATDGGLLQLDIESGKIMKRSDESFQMIFPLSNGDLVTLQSEDTSDLAVPRDSVGDTFTKETRTFSLMKANGASYRLADTMNAFENYGVSEASLLISGELQDALLLYNGSELYVFDYNGNLIFHTAFASDIVGCFVRNDRDFLVILDHGSILELQNSIAISDGSYEATVDSYQVYSSEHYIEDVAYNITEDVLTLHTGNNLLFLSRNADPDMTVLTSEDIFEDSDAQIKEVEYLKTGDFSCRVVYGYEATDDLPLRGLFFKDATYVSLYLPYELSPLLKYRAQDGNCIKTVSVSEEGESIVIEEGPLYSSEITYTQTIKLTKSNHTIERDTSEITDDFNLTAEKNSSITNNLSLDTGFYGFELTLSSPENSLPYAVVENGFYDEISGEISAISHKGDMLYIGHLYSYQEMLERLEKD